MTKLSVNFAALMGSHAICAKAPKEPFDQANVRTIEQANSLGLGKTGSLLYDNYMYKNETRRC